MLVYQRVVSFWDGLVSGQLFFCQLLFCRSEIVPETGGTLEVTWREIMASGRSRSKHRKDVQKNDPLFLARTYLANG